MAFVITAACIDKLDGSCLAVCPVDCIYEGERSRYINPIECIDCGACESTCPVEAIFNEFDVPEPMREFVSDNQRFFTDPLPLTSAPIGNPGGAKGVGRIGRDTELVAHYKSRS
jgi:NAD-dependent dihydropyrimidine dehydrogenase PreA subunit